MGSYKVKYVERNLSEVETLSAKAGVNKEAAEKVLRQMKADAELQQVKPQPPEGGITINDAARQSGISSGTISRWVTRGYIPVLMRTRNETYIDAAKFKAFINVYKTDPGQGKWTIKKMATV